jgi:hypothetical protein
MQGQDAGGKPQLSQEAEVDLPSMRPGPNADREAKRASKTMSSTEA